LTEWQEFSLLRLRLETGRTHQIRVHLSDAGHPVAGDPVYGGRRRAGSVADTRLRTYVKGLGRQMLHAAVLGIRHPETGEYMEFTCDMPGDMKAFLAMLNEVKDASSP
ncbi:MAG TPA: RluA family pseudouridine synthase, partial [Deltaproteobacteria bacterium]|nr:RluA family pseudouridine synthase [Deltaproteobacteria bacterium]